jgi:hypothetical protein
LVGHIAQSRERRKPKLYIRQFPDLKNASDLTLPGEKEGRHCVVMVVLGKGHAR